VPGGQYEFRVGAFGLHGMSSILMRYMHSIFGRPVLSFDAAGRARPGTCPPMLGSFVQVYCDDILIFSKTREEHLVHVRMVLETLRHHKLYAKASKCQFGRASDGFLGHVISEHGVSVDPRKVAAVAEWAKPSSCTDSDVRRFVGLANYYRKFVLRFSALAAPLTALCSPRASKLAASAVFLTDAHPLARPSWAGAWTAQLARSRAGLHYQYCRNLVQKGKYRIKPVSLQEQANIEIIQMKIMMSNFNTMHSLQYRLD
jgi:hypothetical protein